RYGHLFRLGGSDVAGVHGGSRPVSEGMGQGGLERRFGPEAARNDSPGTGSDAGRLRSGVAERTDEERKSQTGKRRGWGVGTPSPLLRPRPHLGRPRILPASARERGV